MDVYKNWMSFLKDDVKLTKAVIPSAHNACSYGLKFMGKCQDGNLYKQYKYGVRHFCIRLDTDKDGNVIVCHGISKGGLFEKDLRCIKRMLKENDSEFFIFDIREYYPQNVGPITLKSHANRTVVNRLLKKYIHPEKYAFTDFDNIADVTMEDIRKSGKRYILYNYEKAYKYSVNCNYIFPWDKKIYGLKAHNFAKEVTSIFDKHLSDGLYWFQVQQTPNFGTEIGITKPKKLDDALRPHFKAIIDKIAENTHYLESANIIASDFMTTDHLKSKMILKLNVMKNNIKEDMKEIFEKGLEEVTLNETL